MKILFTRFQEEITTVKKSVTQFRVETGSPKFKPDELTVIDITPEPSGTKRGDDRRTFQGSFEDQKIPLAFNGKAEYISDIVDLHGISKRNTLCPITYSVNGVLQGNPNDDTCTDKRLGKTDHDHNKEDVLAYRKSDDLAGFSSHDEKRAQYRFVTRKFITIQEMIEHQRSQEKRVLFELTI